MSMTNAISAVTILGAVLIFSVELGFYEKLLGVTAIVMATFNVVGGFVITDRMLKLFSLFSIVRFYPWCLKWGGVILRINTKAIMESAAPTCQTRV
jgi:hypothetical protein